MSKLIVLLQGKKTYFTVALAVLYVGGAYLGFWEMKDEVLAGLGLGALAFLRAGIKKAESTAARKLALLAAMLPLSLGLTGCGTIQPGNDPVVVNAERTTQVALDVFDTFLRWEYDNRLTLSATPEVRKAADYIRANGQAWLISARTMTKAYKQNRTAENKADLETIITVVRAGIDQARHYLEAGLPAPNSPGS